jgi:protein tyrosine phosphatase (PTP) superfamily phosphohydrolase (DUF442 family)
MEPAGRITPMTTPVRATTILFIALLFAPTAQLDGAAPQTAPQASQGTTGQDAQPSIAHVIGRKLRDKGLPNLGEVTPSLYRGAQPTAAGIEALKTMGIEVVINLRSGPNDDEEAELTKLGMRYVAIPSHCWYPHDETFARFLAVVRENQGKKIFVHCHQGQDRTGMAIASYRIAEQGWTVDEAMKEMQAFGFTGTHHLTCPGLADYEKQFPQHLKNNPAFHEVGPK